MRVLITGANGFLGRHVVIAVAGRGHDVRALIRSPDPVRRPFDEGIEMVVGDLRNRHDAAAAVANVDAVIHLAASVKGDDDFQFINTVVGTENLLDAIYSAGVDRLVLCSSFSVYDWKRAGTTLDEQCPLETELYARDGYAIAKSWQERLVCRYADRHHLRHTVLRPGFIWGRGNIWLAGTGHTFGKWHLVFGGCRDLPITYVENCAECIAIALEHPAAAGETFNVVDSERVTAWRYMGQAISATGTPGRRIYVPYWMGLTAATVAKWCGRLVFGRSAKLPGLLIPIRYRARFRPLRFTGAKVQRLLGWRPRWSFAEAWRRVTEDETPTAPATDTDAVRTGPKEVAVE